MTKTTIHIDGMSCGHCIQWISSALEKVDGVENVHVSLESQNASVEYDESTTTEEMMQGAIEKAGYTVKSFA